jgi:photosystem II stability/assembly factor-like uncharacterized protein
MNLKLVLFLLLSFLVLAGCDDDDGPANPNRIKWKALGLDGKTVNQMQLPNNKLYIATNSGLYKYKVGAAAGSFELIGFSAKNVQAIEVIDDGHLIASLYDKSGINPPALYITDDEGDTWEPAPQFGGNAPEPVFDFAIRPDDPDVWYATGLGVVAKSVDAGQTWTPVWGAWGLIATGISVVTVNPRGNKEIWAGGQGAIENGFLLRSENETVWDLWDDLADNPSTVKEITFGEKGPDHLLVGFEGALVETEDGGTNWNTLIDSDQHKFFFGICTSKTDSDVFYAGGWLKTPDPQPLKLHITTDGGETFKEEASGIW